MTKKELNYIAEFVADKVIAEMQRMFHFDVVDNNSEEKLLSDLAQAMTALDYNLKLENYTRCSQLQDEIKNIEKQLKNLK
jgi:TolB-like protein|tara:strand:+ start:507 stop:746 length:240 start_codon:yes stop_codon:yes gene_type:complete